MYRKLNNNATPREIAEIVNRILDGGVNSVGSITLTEGTETIIFLLAICTFPEHFPILAYVFAGMCWITTISRIIGGYYTLNKNDP